MGRILVVDDEKSIRITLKAFLNEDGHEVQAAENVAEALDMLKETDFDVVLSDIILPRVTGVELLKSIRGISPFVQVIMMTGEPTVETAAESLRSGAFDYLSKPISKDKILTTTRNALSVKKLEDDNRRLGEENRRYQEELENLVEERTRALQESENRFRVLFEGTTSCILFIEDRTLKYFNQAALKTFGYSAEEMIGKDAALIHVSQESYEEAIAIINTALKEKGSWFGEWPFRKKNGEIIWMENSISALADGGMVEILHDITDRRRAEEDLKNYSERLEDMVEKRTQALKDLQEEMIRKEKMAVLGQLAGGVGHELRNPLGVISNAVYYLKMVQPDADKTVKEYLETISEEVNRSTEIVTDLLDLSRTRAAGRERVEVSMMVKEALDRNRPPDGIEAVIELPDDPLPLYVDSRQIEQVLNNLITNAFQAMRDGGTLTVGAGVEGDTIIISVSDTGIGISPENMEKIFEPLFTTKAKGIGLGLVLTKNLVEINGGTIEVISQEGKGSTFTLTLPTMPEREI